MLPSRPDGGRVPEPVAKHVISFAALMEALVTALPVVTVITSLGDTPRGITRRHSSRLVELELLPTGDAQSLSSQSTYTLMLYLSVKVIRNILFDALSAGKKNMKKLALGSYT